jgi:hypothetical protein
MGKDRVFGWVVSAALHAILLLGAGLATIKSSGGSALGDMSGDMYYSLSLREGPSGQWSPQFIIRDAVVPLPEASETAQLTTPQVLPDDGQSRCRFCDEELRTGFACPVCSAKRPALKESGSDGPRITDAALKQAGTRRSGLRGYGVGQVDWPPKELCGFDLINR